MSKRARKVAFKEVDIAEKKRKTDGEEGEDDFDGDDAERSKAVGVQLLENLDTPPYFSLLQNPDSKPSTHWTVMRKTT